MIQKEQLVIYGAGKGGCRMYEFFSFKKWDDLIYGFCDRNYDNIKEIFNKKVYNYSELKGKGKIFLISVADIAIFNDIMSMMEADGENIITLEKFLEFMGEDQISFNRDVCALAHMHADDYFDEAEKKENLDIFWKEDSDFYKLFQQLDLTNIIELACGKGRHILKYLPDAQDVTLVDILQRNIDFCRERFRNIPKIYYYCNNGFNLEQLETGKYTALFSYDAVVHFEMMDIYEYLKDINRVLAKNGRVLIHHSNYAADYKVSFASGPGNRNFMSKEIFAHLAYRAGFSVLEQKIINWCGVPELDCVTLLEKRTL